MDKKDIIPQNNEEKIFVVNSCSKKEMARKRRTPCAPLLKNVKFLEWVRTGTIHRKSCEKFAKLDLMGLN